KSAYKGLLLFRCQSPKCRTLLQVSNFFISLCKLFLQSFNFSPAACLGVISLALILFSSSVSGSINQLIPAQSIDVRDNFGRPERKETNNAKPKPEIRPPTSICNRVPSRQWHEWLPWLLTVAAAFLLGLRISDWMYRRHIERLRDIWRK